MFSTFRRVLGQEPDHADEAEPGATEPLQSPVEAVAVDTPTEPAETTTCTEATHTVGDAPPTQHMGTSLDMTNNAPAEGAPAEAMTCNEVTHTEGDAPPTENMDASLDIADNAPAVGVADMVSTGFRERVSWALGRITATPQSEAAGEGDGGDCGNALPVNAVIEDHQQTSAASDELQQMTPSDAVLSETSVPAAIGAADTAGGLRDRLAWAFDQVRERANRGGENTEGETGAGNIRSAVVGAAAGAAGAATGTAAAAFGGVAGVVFAAVAATGVVAAAATSNQEEKPSNAGDASACLNTEEPAGEGGEGGSLTLQPELTGASSTSEVTDTNGERRCPGGADTAGGAATADTILETATLQPSRCSKVPISDHEVSLARPGVRGAATLTTSSNSINYGDEMLAPQDFERTTKLFTLLELLHEQNPQLLGQLCRDEGFVQLHGGSARAFVRSCRQGLLSGRARKEIFFLGSEADMANRPETFVDCWIRTNASIELVPLDTSICPRSSSACVHSGFQSAYLRIADALREALLQVEGDVGSPDLDISAPSDGSLSPPCAVTVVGYSLGGALATLAAAELVLARNCNVELITFGAPRAGNDALRELLQSQHEQAVPSLRIARFVNALDLVPHVPFNPKDTDDSIWQGIEQTIFSTLPQERLVGSCDVYCHVAPATCLDMLAVSVSGFLARLASGFRGASSTLSFSAQMPAELISSHRLTAYAASLRGVCQPPWVVLSSSLMASQVPLAILSAASSLVPVASTSAGPAAAAAATAEAGALSLYAMSATEVAAVGTAGAAGIAGSGVVAAIVLPQILGAAVSAYSCHRICKRLEGLSDELKTHAEQMAGTMGELAEGIALLSGEMSHTAGRLDQRLEELGSIMHYQRVEDYVIRVRVAKRQIVDELAMYADGPSTARSQAVRDAARDLRKVSGELLEVAVSWQSTDDARLKGSDLARLLCAVVSSSHLALLATAVTDEDDAPLRASQALVHTVPVLGRFYWSYLASGSEPWAEELSAEQSQFLALAMAVSARRPGASGALEQLCSCAPAEALFAILGLQPESHEVRAALALALPSSSSHTSPSTPVALPAPRAWILAQAAEVRRLGRASAAIASSNCHPRLTNELAARQPSDSSAKVLFLAGLICMVPIAGQDSTPDQTAELWAEAVAWGADLVGTLRTLNNTGKIPPESWTTLASATRMAHHVGLAWQLYCSCVLPEATAQELRTWLRAEASVGDLPGAPMAESTMALQQMADALAKDARCIDGLLARSRDVFQDLAEMLQVATAHLGSDGQGVIEEVKASLDRELSALNEDKRYVLFGGLVSAGKTTLVNALLLHLLPAARDELKEDGGGRLNLMPTCFNENTRIVTELELTPLVKEIEVRLLVRASGLNANGGGTTTVADSANITSMDELAETVGEQETADDMAADGTGRFAQPSMPNNDGSGFSVAAGYPLVFSGPKSWRKLQKRIRDVCEQELPDNAMRRLHIRLPCGGIAQSVSIIDTPGLDSPTVWQQIQTLVHTKAFLFVWVGALDAPTAFGLQGRRLVDLYRSTGHPLPPVLVLTKWDRLKMLPEFQEDPRLLAGQAQMRLSQLHSGLLPPDNSTVSVTCTRLEELEVLAAALVAALRGQNHQWMLAQSVAVGAKSVHCGSVLLAMRSLQAGSEIEAATVGNIDACLRTLQLPAVLRFSTEESEAQLLLASMNAAAAVIKAESPGRETAAADLAAFWGSLLPLLSGLSEPLRISRRLHKIVVATQRLVNILLKDDQQAAVFEQNREELQETQRRVIQSFSERVDQYFQGFPRLAQPPEFVPAGCRSQVSLRDYRPPAGLERSECAISLIPAFVLEAHEGAQHEKSQFRYVKAVSTVVIERWQSKFLENMMRLERDCLQQLQDHFHEIMSIRGLINHSDWQADLQSLITSPIEAVGFGCLAGLTAGGYVGLLAEAVAGIGLGVGVGIGLLVAAGVAAICFEDSALAKNLGIWTFEEGQICAAQTVLDILNKQDFQAKAKELVLHEFQRRLEACMNQLADIRDPAASTREEARAALSIQARVAELQRALSLWFSSFVGSQVGRDPWLVTPPTDLRMHLDAGPRDGVAQGAAVASRSPRQPEDSSDSSDEQDS